MGRSVHAAITDQYDVVVLVKPSRPAAVELVRLSRSTGQEKDRLGRRITGRGNAFDGKRQKARSFVVAILRDDQRAALGFVFDIDGQVNAGDNVKGARARALRRLRPRRRFCFRQGLQPCRPNRRSRQLSIQPQGCSSAQMSL